MNNAHIPEALKARNQWLAWRYEVRDGKETKVPIDAKSGRYGQSNNPRTWAAFDVAWAALQNGKGYDGIGFAFAEGDGLTGIDIDHPWDSPIAVKIREQFQGTYCEKSPRGKLRIFCHGKPQRCGKGTEDKAVEVYDYTSPRYLTVTGQWIEGTSRDITESQVALDWLYEAYFKPRPQAEAKKPKSSGTVSQSNQDIIEKATAARNGAKFATLFYGGWQAAGYHSQSEADAALCSLLAFWTQDGAQIDSIFRQSALMRPKWGKRHHADGRTYGEATIERALGSVTQMYQGTAQHGKQQGKERREEGAEHTKEPIPLIPEQEPPLPYPLDALGKLLGNAAQAIAEYVQVPKALAGQSVLAAASLSVQPFYEVDIPSLGKPMPLSLNALIIAESGDRKSSTDNQAIRPITAYQHTLWSAYEKEKEAYAAALADYLSTSSKGRLGRGKPIKPRQIFL